MSEYLCSNHLERGSVCRICLQTGGTFRNLPMELIAVLQILVPEMPSIMHTCEYCGYLAAKFVRFARQCRQANRMLTNSSLSPRTQLRPCHNLVTTMPVIESFGGVDVDILKTEEMSVCGDEPGSVDENDEGLDNDDDEIPLAMINKGVDVEYELAQDPISFDAPDTKVELEPIKRELSAEQDREESPPKGKEKSKKKGTKRQKSSKKEQDGYTANDRFTSRMVRETDRYLVVKLTKDEVRQQMADRSTSEAYLAAPFKCVQCVKGFNFEDVLRNHMERHSKVLKMRRKRLTPEERLEKKRLAERLRKARIREDPYLYDQMRQKSRDHYLKKKQAGKATPVSAKTPKEQMKMGARNRKDNKSYRRKLPISSPRKMSKKPRKQTIEERLEHKKLAERRRRAMIKENPELCERMRQKAREYHIKKRQDGKIVPISALTPEKQQLRRMINRETSRRYYQRKKLAKSKEQSGNADETADEKLQLKTSTARCREAKTIENTELNELLHQKLKECYLKGKQEGQRPSLSASTPEERTKKMMQKKKSYIKCNQRKRLSKSRETLASSNETNADESSVLNTPRQKRTLEERRELKIMAERRRKARIKENPELYERMRQKSKEYYQKKRQSGKILPISALTPEEQTIKRLNNRESSKRCYIKKTLAKLAEPVISCGEISSDDMDPLLD